MEWVLFVSSSRQRAHRRSSGRQHLNTSADFLEILEWFIVLNIFLILLQVYNKNRTADEFMGSSTISLKNLELYKWGIHFLLYFREYFCVNNKDVISDHHFYFIPFPSLDRTYEMELRLDDAKSKEDDMGVILVDVCLMFRDATIKRGPVRVFVIWEIFTDTILCAESFLFILIHIFLFFFSKKWAQRKNKVWILLSLHTVFTSKFQLLFRMPGILSHLTL